jgi:hypothetical protein
MEPADEILHLIQELTGQDCPLPERSVPKTVADLLNDRGAGLGHSQFNELMLSLGYDRVTHAFFQYLVDEKTEYRSGSSLHSIDDLKTGVDRFRKLGMLLDGNVKYAFKRISSDDAELRHALSFLVQRDEQSFKDRHQPIHPIERISSDKTYYLGYLIERELQKRLKDNPDDPSAKVEERVRQQTVAIGKRNHEAFLVSDHLDVYIATSMRERHEFRAVDDLTKAIFKDPQLVHLKLRYFNPTQAYCPDRVDKGIAEALMLKRARCTIYFAQESDTLGKDSELASTLAQGKPVVAYIPDPPADFAKKLLCELMEAYPKRSEHELLLEQLRLFDPIAAWSDPLVRKWIDSNTSFDIGVATERLQVAIKSHYDRRAKTLREDHPLGIQVNLNNGVANGVLVVRNVAQCAELIRGVVLRNLEFDIENKNDGGMKYSYLRERISGCIFRVVTGDKMLTNAFWNFYLLSPIE